MSSEDTDYWLTEFARQVDLFTMLDLDPKAVTAAARAAVTLQQQRANGSITVRTDRLAEDVDGAPWGVAPSTIETFEFDERGCPVAHWVKPEDSNDDDN